MNTIIYPLYKHSAALNYKFKQDHHFLSIIYHIRYSILEFLIYHQIFKELFTKNYVFIINLDNLKIYFIFNRLGYLFISIIYREFLVIDSINIEKFYKNLSIQSKLKNIHLLFFT